MEWTALLLLLASQLAVVGGAADTCQFKVRRAKTIASLQSKSWQATPAQSTWNSCRPKHGWTVCAHFITNNGDSVPDDCKWTDYYAGCYDYKWAEYDAQTQLVEKYCTEPTRSTCNVTQDFKHPISSTSSDCKQTPDAGLRIHKPSAMCCWPSGSPELPLDYAFAQQQLVKTPPPQGPMQTVRCNRSMSTATTRSGLLSVAPVSEPEEQCDAVWAPCAEFVYKIGHDEWRWWRAGCSYKYGSVNYKDIVEQFCATAYKCKQFDMIEPTTRGLELKELVFTDAFVCCCHGTGCEMPDTVAFSLGVAQTLSPPTTTATQPATAPSTSEQPVETSTGARAASTGAAPTGDGDGGSLLWLWLLLVVAALLLTIAAVVATTAVVRQKRKAAEERKELRAIEAEGVAPMLPFSAYVPRTETGAKASKGDDAPPKGSETGSVDASKSASDN